MASGAARTPAPPGARSCKQGLAREPGARGSPVSALPPRLCPDSVKLQFPNPLSLIAFGRGAVQGKQGVRAARDPRAPRREKGGRCARPLCALPSAPRVGLVGSRPPRSRTRGHRRRRLDGAGAASSLRATVFYLEVGRKRFYCSAGVLPWKYCFFMLALWRSCVGPCSSGGDSSRSAFESYREVGS